MDKGIPQTDLHKDGLWQEVEIEATVLEGHDLNQPFLFHAAEGTKDASSTDPSVVKIALQG